MNARDTAALLGLLITLLGSIIVAAWWHWIEAPSRAGDQPHKPRHALDFETPGDLTADMLERDQFRTKWTVEELRAMADDPRPAVPALDSWDFAWWESDQQQWLEGAREAARRQDRALESGEWADAWWTRRR